MTKKRHQSIVRLCACAVVALIGALLVGCGASTSTSDSANHRSGAASEPSSHEPSSQFFGRSAANQFSKFGTESTVAERQEAAIAVAESLEARAARDWASQCATLSRAAVKLVMENPAAPKGGDCAKALGALGEKASPKILDDNLQGAVVALRVRKTKGYALYHGTDKKDWALPMEKDGGTWKVAALVAEEIAYPPAN